MDPFQNHPTVPQRPKASGCSTVMFVFVALGLVGGGGALAWYSQTHHLSLSAEPQYDQVGMNGEVSNPQAGNEIEAWTGGSTFECTGADHVTISGRTIAGTASPALRATGACHLDLVGVTLSSPIAIEATGGSHVSITGGSITGTIAAIDASGVAEVNVTGATINGPVRRGGASHVNGVERK